MKGTPVRKRGAEGKEAELVEDEVDKHDNNHGDSGNVTVRDLEMESDILGGTSIGKEAELRLQKARCNAMEKKLEKFIEIQRDRDRKTSEQQKIIKELEAKLKKVERERDGANRKLEA